MNDSVAELLISNKDPRDNIKRPFTALIDKEIARERSRSRERSLSQGSGSSRSRSPSEGRPRFAYPDKVLSLGPLHDPIASSTHKSMEIKAHMSNNGDLDSPRSSVRGQGQNRVRGDRASPSNKQNSKVVFSNKNEYNDESEKHSPSFKSSSQLFNDPEYAQFYKKLSPEGRKRELLKQRQALLDEQQRLKEILDKQERQLKERQYEYNKRQELQKERMEFYQKGGKFPALKLDFDGEEVEGQGSVERDSGLGVRSRDAGGAVVEKGLRLHERRGSSDGASSGGESPRVHIGEILNDNYLH